MPGLSWRLRPARAEDVPALAALYAGAARALGPSVYGSRQVEAWAGFGQDTPAFRDYVLGADTWLAETLDEAPQPLGFSGADDSGEVRSLYVHAGFGRQGLGGTLLAATLDRARSRGLRRFEAWVTPLSRPVFERAGFRLVQTVQAEFAGAWFERYRVAL
jgi:putative acetyltransferase